jgi:hypothetical protein
MPRTHQSKSSKKSEPETSKSKSSKSKSSSKNTLVIEQDALEALIKSAINKVFSDPDFQAEVVSKTIDVIKNKQSPRGGKSKPAEAKLTKQEMKIVENATTLRELGNRKLLLKFIEIHDLELPEEGSNKDGSHSNNDLKSVIKEHFESSKKTSKKSPKKPVKKSKKASKKSEQSEESEPSEESASESSSSEGSDETSESSSE